MIAPIVLVAGDLDRHDRLEPRGWRAADRAPERLGRRRARADLAVGAVAQADAG
jgi:hypothetical protein